MPTSLRQKLGVKPGSRCILLQAPDHLCARFELSLEESVKRLEGPFDYIHFFCTLQRELHAALLRLKPHIRAGGMLWVSWPKAGQLSTDLSLKEVIRLAYDAGFVESKTISIDPTWSAIKLTFPKSGKRYANSYGSLPLAEGGGKTETKPESAV
jgi:hypothetical protein